MDREGLARLIVNSALKVHTVLGPGLLESAYEVCLAHEIRKNGAAVERQCSVPLRYDGIQIDAGYRVDLLVGNEVVIELKAVEKFLPIHTAQLLSYLRLGGWKLGFLLNFNVTRMKDGIRRVVHNL